MIYDNIIIGGGPAGLTAGIYLSRAKMKVLILDTGMAGGQMVLTHEIANYPGYESISGFMLASNMQSQAKKHGCEIKTNVKIDKYELEGDTKRIIMANGDVYESRSVILSTGGRSREIGAIREGDFAGRGISYCATCDGDFFQDREIMVVGGGNSALEEAVSLTTYASKVTIIHMLDEWQGFESAIKEMEANPKIDYIMNTKITEFIGEQGLKSVILENVKTGEKEERNIDGVFIFIGYVPNNEVFKGQVELNKWGEIVTDDKFATSIKGVYAAGDNIHKTYRQVTTAVGDGTNAALYTLEYLNS